MDSLLFISPMFTNTPSFASCMHVSSTLDGSIASVRASPRGSVIRSSAACILEPRTDSMPLPRCSFAQQLSGPVTWDMQRRSIELRNARCSLNLPLDLDRAHRCLAHRTITFLGDSEVRDLAMAMASLLSGVTVAEAEERSLGQPNWRPDIWEGVHPARRGIMRALLNESATRKKTDGSRGSWTDPEHGWTIRAYHDLPRSVHWRAIARILHESSSLRHKSADGVSFVQLGIHDTNSKISELGSAALRWRDEPLERWTHGPVFQPFLDHWCDLHDQRARSNLQHHPASGSSTRASHASGTPASDPALRSTKWATKWAPWSPPPAAAASLMPPLIWMTANEQCKAKKPRKWRYQVELIRAANLASASAGSDVGVPVLDWWPLYANETHRCQLTTDGVHSRQWVDHLKASILLSYLCDAHGRFAAPSAYPAASFNVTAARCKPRAKQQRKTAAG